MRHCSGTAQSFPKKIRFARRPCAKPPPPRSGRRGPGQISSGASPASPRPDCLDPGPSSKSAEKGGPGPAGPPCRRIGVVAVEPPSPPVWTLILGVRAPPKSDPKGSNFSGFLDPCGAKSRGGGGAPPTTLILLRNQRQPADRRRAPRPHTVRDPPRTVRQPRPARSASPDQPKGQNLLFAACELCGREVVGSGVCLSWLRQRVPRPGSAPAPPGRAHSQRGS